MISALLCLVGALVLIAIAYLVSIDRGNINWRSVITAFGLQIGLAAIVLYIPLGQSLLAGMTTGVSAVLDYAQDGIVFLFGDIGRGKLGFIFAFQVLPAVIFFSALISVLYYIGVMQWVVKIIGGTLKKLLRTSAPESMSAATNIFIGQTEALFTIKPFVAHMSRSELFAVMVGGLATVAGATMAGYVALGVSLNYLIAASFMAAPGAIAMAKIFGPEESDTQFVETLDGIDDDEGQPVNVIDAAAKGATSGMQLAANVGAMLIAFIGLIAMFNGVFGSLGGLVGIPDLSIELVLGYVFSPLAWLMGIEWSEAVQSGSYIGQKIVLNEFVAYVDFVATGQELGEHTKAVITFALCGFANLSSIAILLGGLGLIAPTRRAEIATLGMRALLAASLANFMSATIASFFLQLA